MQDGTASLADIDFTVALDATNWGGNMPAAGLASYSSIATLTADNLDAVFYTNHSFSWVVTGTNAARLNGAIVSRNENIAYNTPSLQIDYDAPPARRVGGAGRRHAPHRLVGAADDRWQRLDTDPLRYLALPVN